MVTATEKTSVFEQGALRYLIDWELEKIRSVRIGIAGAGGLGSNCAHFLVRCGFRRFVLVDGDTVDGSNLNRQFFFENQVGQLKVSALRDNLLAIDGSLDIEIQPVMLDTSSAVQVFRGVNVIVEALDKAAAKAMMAGLFMNGDRLLVSGSGIGCWGHPDSIRVKRVKPLFFMVGDFVSEQNETAPPLCPKVVVVAAKQADVVLQMVLGRWDHETDT